MAERHGTNGPGRPPGGTPSEHRPPTPITMYLLEQKPDSAQRYFLASTEKRHPFASTHVLMMRNSATDHPTGQDVASVQYVGDTTTAVMADGHGLNGTTIAQRAARELATSLNINLRTPGDTPTGQRIYKAIEDVASSLGSEGQHSGAAIAIAKITGGDMLSVVPSDAEVILIRGGLPISLPPPKHLSDPTVREEIQRRSDLLETRDEVARRGGVFRQTEHGDFLINGANGIMVYGVTGTFGDRATRINSTELLPFRVNQEYAEMKLESNDLVLLISDGIRRIPQAVDMLTVLLSQRDQLATYRDQLATNPMSRVRDQLTQVMGYSNVEASALIGALRAALDNVMNVEWAHNNIDRALVVLKEFIMLATRGNIPDDITAMVLKPSAKEPTPTQP